MVLEQKVLKYKEKVIFERLVMSHKFRRIPKLFEENEACFLYLTKGAFHFRTPTNILTCRFRSILTPQFRFNLTPVFRPEKSG